MRKFEIDYAKGYVCCSVCFKHVDKKIVKLKWYTQDYASNKRKGKVCKTLQKHPHSIWICDKCIEDLKSEWWKTTNRRFEMWNHNDSEEGERNDD